MTTGSVDEVSFFKPPQTFTPASLLRPKAAVRRVLAGAGAEWSPASLLRPKAMVRRSL